MGVVWRAVDEVLHREVAVKEQRTYTDTAGPELADLRLRMQRDARAAARVRHPGVVAVHDVTEVDGRPVIVRELVDGPSLDDVLRERGTLDPREAAAVGAKVMNALAVAHRVGVLHRGATPGNILLGTGGRVVLTDFGIATMEDPGDGSATLPRETPFPQRRTRRLPRLLGARARPGPGARPRVGRLGTRRDAVRRGGGRPAVPPHVDVVHADGHRGRPAAGAGAAAGAPAPSLTPAPPPGGAIPREPTVRHIPSTPPPGFGPPPQAPTAHAAPPDPVAHAVPASPATRTETPARPRRGKALLAAAAVAVVLAATGVTVAALGGGDGEKSEASDAREAGGRRVPPRSVRGGQLSRSPGDQARRQLHPLRRS